MVNFYNVRLLSCRSAKCAYISSRKSTVYLEYPKESRFNDTFMAKIAIYVSLKQCLSLIQFLALHPLVWVKSRVNIMISNGVLPVVENPENVLLSKVGSSDLYKE